MILEHYEDRNWKITLGRFDFLQKSAKTGTYKNVVIPIFPQDEEIVKGQLKDSYNRIMNHEFDKGCGKDDCHWCNFARKYQLVRPTEDELTEIDDV